MFHLPDAKRIRRDDLHSRNSSSSPPPEPKSTYPDAQKRLSALLNLDLDLVPAPPQDPTAGAAQTTPQETAHVQDEAEEQEFEFRLFSAPAPPRPSESGGIGAEEESTQNRTATTAPTQKLRIRLRSPTPTVAGPGEGRFVNPFRGWGYYFSAPGLLSVDRRGKGRDGEDEDEDAGVLLKRKQFEDVAVSGEEMVRLSGVPWPGCHLPWRVIRLKREHTKLPRDEKGMKSAAPTYVLDPLERVPLSRKKPGKKRRIQLRKRTVASEKAKETEAEKRNRKNREKKLKRRQKARDLKSAAAADPGPTTEPSEGVSAHESD
ncbi:hypothetical protein BDW59DRAFT_143891 [Aspergillus cavernicola]|uniref:Uncharacterized protein n=1 Tax=Aspergillus cavernicola TaxID=176166 RepID=A0ABR4IJA9_9EURO